MLLTRPNTLSEEQCQELEMLKTTTHDVRVYRRTKVILYRNAGYTPDEIHEHTEYSEREQRYVVRRYREEGVAGLHDRPRSGRPKRRAQVDSKEQSVTQEAVASVEVEATSDVEPETTPEVPGDAGAESEPAPEQATEKTGMKLDYWSRETLESMQTYHPKSYLRNRAHMLLLRDDGYSVSEIADMLRISGQTIRQVFAHYDQDKLAGLYREPGSGRESHLKREQWEEFAKWVKEGPKSLGYRFVKWTTRSLRKYLFKRFNIKFSREWIRQKLHQFVGYSWTRGKTVYAYPENKERKTDRTSFSQKMLTYLEQARKREMIVLFEDESLFTLFGEVGYSWSPLGTTQEVPSAGKRERVVVFGAADPWSGRTHYRLEDDSINKDTTLRFLTQLVSYYQKHAPGMPLVIVLDKHPGHTAQLVEDVVKEYEHVTLENTPTHSPELNPQEHIWDWLGEQMIKNEFFETKDALKKAIRHFFCYLAGLKEDVKSCLGDLQKLYSAEVIVDAEF